MKLKNDFGSLNELPNKKTSAEYMARYGRNVVFLEFNNFKSFRKLFLVNQLNWLSSKNPKGDLSRTMLFANPIEGVAPSSRKLPEEDVPSNKQPFAGSKKTTIS